MMKDLGDQKKIRTYAILKEILLSRASKTLIPGLTLNTKAHLMYFYLIPGYKTWIWKLHFQKHHLNKKHGKTVKL